MAEFTKEEEDAAYKAAEEAIEEARRTGATELDLNGRSYKNFDANYEFPLTPFVSLTRLPPQIETLGELRTLGISETQVSDLAPIAAMTELQSVEFNNTQVSDLGPLASLSRLTSIALSGTKVSDLGPLANLTGLQHLFFNNTKVRNLAAIAALTEIKTLSINKTEVSDIGPVAFLNGLFYLALEQTPVNDLSPLAALTSLQSLNLVGTQVSDIAPLATLTGLQSLSLERTQVSDLAALSILTSLQTLSLERTPVSDLSPLATLTGLQTLTLNRTLVSDLGPLARLTGLNNLWLDDTQARDLSPLAGMTGLQNLWLDRTHVIDLSPLAALTRLQSLTLSGSAVRDLRPLLKLSELGTDGLLGLRFADTPATRADPTLQTLSEVEDEKERSEKTLAYLATLPPWPEPLPWLPPEDDPDSAPPAPQPDSVPNINVGADGLDLATSPIDPADLSDPIKARLYAKLPDAVAALLRHGNRYPEVAAPARELVTLTSVAFDSADLLDIHLQLAALTDVRSADADRPLLERLDPDCRTALDAVLRIGPGVTLGHPDVDALETRLAEYARLRQPATVAEGERRVTGALAEREELATVRLRKVAGQVSKAGDEGRVPEYRRGFSRNVIIALGAVASGLTDAAAGFVYGEIAIAAAQFLVLHRDAIMATAPAWGQTGYAWLEYILVRADLILRDAKSGHLNKQ